MKNMSKGLIALLALGGLVVAALAVVVPLIFAVIGAHNRAISVETTFEAQVDVNKNDYDAMWKILSEQAGVTSRYASEFKDIYASLMENRYGDPDKRGANGSLMLWIQEKNPEFSSDMYKNLSQSIEALRTGFKSKQDKLRDLKRVHDEMLRSFPMGLALKALGHKELVYVAVTSTRTENAFSTGKDDESALTGFDKKPSEKE